MLKQKILLIVAVLALVSLFLAPVQTARAALIPVTLGDHPLITADHLDVHYSDELLTIVSGQTANLKLFYVAEGAVSPDYYDITLTEFGLDGPMIVPGDFTIVAGVNSAGSATIGALAVAGEVAGLSTGTNLLTGELGDFGYDPSGDVLEFIFVNLGGEAAGLFGDQFGVRVTNTAFPGNFGVDFDNRLDLLGMRWPNTGAGEATSGIPAVIPEPGSLLLIGSGLLGLVGLRRTRQD